MNKVKSFIEYILQYRFAVTEYVKPVADFYNQKFDVGMLVNPHRTKVVGDNLTYYQLDCTKEVNEQAEQNRLFEGWEFNKEEHPYDYEWNSKNVSVYMNNGNEYVISLDFTDHSMIIRTVNDLITFCNTEGIELTWNPNNQTIKNLNLN